MKACRLLFSAVHIEWAVIYRPMVCLSLYRPYFDTAKLIHIIQPLDFEGIARGQKLNIYDIAHKQMHLNTMVMSGLGISGNHLGSLTGGRK